MPAFTFEKLSPPAPRAPAPPVVKKRRGMMVQMFSRFAKMRARRSFFFRQKAPANSLQSKPQD
jgi:hypothetical protein